MSRRDGHLPEQFPEKVPDGPFQNSQACHDELPSNLFRKLSNICLDGSTMDARVS